MGVIPTDWAVADIGSVAVKVGSGITPTGGQRVYREYGRPFVRSQNVGWGRLLLDDVVFIDDATHSRFPETELRIGDVLLNITGASIGRSAVANDRLLGGNVNQHVCIIRSDAHFLVPGFLNQFLLSAAGQRQIDSFQAGGNRQGLNFRQVRSVHLILPPTVAEQHAISTALGDVDALLDGLTRLIAKKRDLKRAAMQQLLTGRTRLPGFSGEWEERRLGDHVRFLRNGVNARADLTPEGRVKYLHYGDVHACNEVYLSPQSLPSLPGAKAVPLDRLRDGDLILADASEDIEGVSKSVEMRGVGSTEVVAGLHTIAARFDSAVLADGFKAYLQDSMPFKAHLRRLAAGTKVYATTRAHVASVEMRLPPLSEQRAIATAISDMDAELAALEARLGKTRALKQAMMQELLTGKTRLV
jgi:type I restriction enzyme S subunit